MSAKQKYQKSPFTPYQRAMIWLHAAQTHQDPKALEGRFIHELPVDPGLRQELSDIGIALNRMMAKSLKVLPSV
ncbi:MAG: hypothetical protein KTR14_11555 [Vampirovibrio sp.]|nr:hypothetical protein [Vampirovibrio sp.]